MNRRECNKSSMIAVGSFGLSSTSFKKLLVKKENVFNSGVQGLITTNERERVDLMRSVKDMATGWMRRYTIQLTAMLGLNNNIGSFRIEADPVAIKHPISTPNGRGNGISGITIIMKRLLLLLTISFFLSHFGFSQSSEIKYSIPQEPWVEKFGNSRAVIWVDKPNDAVYINFLWRRHDLSPDKHRFVIVNAENGKEIKNIYRLIINNERCELVFGPVKNAGTYYFYYLPYIPVTNQYHAGDYLTPEDTPDEAWIKGHNLALANHGYKDVTEATVKEIQARTDFHSFYPMEVVATKAEVSDLLLNNRNDYLIFAEDRAYPIRMTDALPLRWIQEKPGEDFYGEARRNEYYAFQLGIYASRMIIENIRLKFSDLKDKTGNLIPATSFTCINTDGIDTWGNPFTKVVTVKQGKVQALWVGIDVPGNAVPGNYEGTITVKPVNSGEQKVKVFLKVEHKYLADRGDGEPWRHSRLRWLNSTLGIDSEPVNPYILLKVDNRKISCLGRSVQLNDNGLPEKINTWGNNILSSPINFIVETDNKEVVFPAGNFIFKEKKNGIVSWESITENNILKIECHGEMEFDGRLSYKCKVTSKTDIHIQDIRLELPLKKDFATYMVGMGRMGGFTPKNHLSRWVKTEDSFWIGETTGGIQCELRGGSYHGPLLNLYQPNPPASWFNGLNGGYRIDSDENTVTASAYSGARKMEEGQSVTYEFALLITPVKKLDSKEQFSNRYFHGTEPSEEVVANGGNVMNIHHATAYNPYINYPFIAQKEMRGLVDKWHTMGWKVKIYYTVRELSNHLTEIWALRSLGFEVLADGGGGGYQWLQEHLVSDYTPQWYTHLGDGEVDAAILNGSESRWYNYYIEGLAWLIKNMNVDGLYLDDVSFDRHILKRIRRVLDMNKPGCMIDLHSNTTFSLGSANQNLELFPYIDKTWFGEGFNFDIMPADFWLTEISGIPFGIPNDMLLHMAVNNRRGMLFGMTSRGFWPMWKLWDEFGIAGSKMVGFWGKNPAITINHENVYATAYVKKDKILIIIGSWVNKPVNVKLNIDWGLLGLKPSAVNIVAPEIEDYQKEMIFKDGETFPVDAKGDLLLIISKK